MAMIEITNGEVTSKVPYTAYESQYKKLGFRPVSDSGVEEKKDVTPVEDKTPVKEVKEAKEVKENEVSSEDDEDVNDENEDDAFVEDILEKPLSQWTPDELKKFAEIKDIDTSKAKKVSDARAIIKKYLDEQEKAKA